MINNSLNPGNLPAEEKRHAIPRHVLSLSGGGCRGIFTAKVLEEMESARKTDIVSRYDLIGGTSIGGILAIGLACGLKTDFLFSSINTLSPKIFFKRNLFGGLIYAPYKSNSLKSAVQAILGKYADRPFSDIKIPLVVVAVNERSCQPVIFRTYRASPDLPIIDVAMATSAAPTFFSPHRCDAGTFVDGGIIANSPELILVNEIMSAYGAQLEHIHLCCIGTAGTPRLGDAEGRPGQLGWILRHSLVDLSLDGQQALAAELTDGLGLGSILRIDGRPSKKIKLDDASIGSREHLRDLARTAVSAVKTSNPQSWGRFISHVAVRS